MEKERLIRFFLIGVIFICSILLLFENVTIHGRVTGGDVVSNVSVFLSFSIDFSDALANGVFYGDVLVLPVSNIGAVENYNGTDNATNYYVGVSPDGNTPVDLCVNVNSPLITESMDVIGVANQSYSYSNFSNYTFPEVFVEVPFSLDYQSGGEMIPTGGLNFFRFWLDVPVGQSPGNYNNSINFRAVPAGLGC